MHSKETQLFINRCFKDGQIRVIKPTLGESYSFPGEEKLVKFTKLILEELSNTDQIQVRMVDDKTAIIQGVLKT